MTAPPTEDELVVHILLQGRALCGQEGLPCDWPPNHKWVGAVHDPDIAKANCQPCKTEHKRRKLA